jgi:uncharacterized delta-60 repeat protein
MNGNLSGGWFVRRAPRAGLAGLAVVTGFLAAAPPRLPAADVITYTAGKLHHFNQFSTNSAAEDLVNPWEGGAAVYITARTNLSGATFGPAAGGTNYSLAFRINRFEYQNYYGSQAALDAALSNGVYAITMQTVHDGTNIADVSFQTNAYPAAPHLTCFAAAQAVDSTVPFTVTWDAFATGTTNDFILLIASPTSNESRTNYFISPLPNQPGVLNGTNRQFVIPANSLPPGYSGFIKLTFLKVTDKNAGAYPGVPGYGGFGAVTLMPFKTLPRIGAPQIVQSSLSRTGAVASTVYFYVTATGGNLSYQWLRNGAPVGGATTATWPLVGLQPSDAASYSVVVSNSFGAITSTPPAQLTVTSGSAGGADPFFKPQACPNNIVNVVRLQRDGRLLVGGSFNRALGRYNPDGTLDSTFVLGSALGSGQQVSAMEILPDGKILIGGSIGYYDLFFVGGVTRLNPDGSLDTSFNAGGRGANGWVYALAVQPDGKILIGGDFTAYNGTSRTNLARLNSDGSLDATFAPVNGANSRVTCFAPLADGRIVAGGWFTSIAGQARNYLACLNTNGSFNAGFNSGVGPDGFIDTVVSRPNGRLLVGGTFNTFNGVLNRKIIGLQTNGVPDVTFVTGTGITSVYGNSLGEVASVAVQPDGRVVLAGEFTFYTNSFNNDIVRLYADGSKDTNFTAGANAKINSVIAPGDGSVIIGGNFSSYGSCYLARLLSDSGFAPPAIVASPASQTNLFGSVTTFSVTAVGTGLAYQWQKNGADIAGATGSSYVIPYTLDTDAGSYTVRVQNLNGTVTGGPATLVVLMTPEFTWLSPGKGTNNTYGRGIVADFFGNTYVAGLFNGTLTNLGNPVSSVAGGQDALLVKFDPLGKPVWARSAGGSSLDSGWAVALDPSGNVLLAGTIRGTVNFGSTVITASGGSYDAFVAKYDLAGNLLWVRSGGGAGTDRGLGVTADPAGNVYLSGFYNGDADFGTNHILGFGTFLAKYDAAGAAVWVSAIPAIPCCNAGRALAADKLGNVYMAGIFNGTVSFGTNQLISSGTNNNMFIAKYDVAGNVQWVRRSGGPAGGDAFGVAVGPDGSPVMSGYFYTASDFGPFNLTAASANAQLFVAKYTAAGDLQWVRQAGGTGDIVGYGTAIDPLGDTWVTGEASGLIDFGGKTFSAPGPVGTPDVFITRYSPIGDLLSVFQAGGTNVDYGFAISTDGAGNAYVTGDYYGIGTSSFGSFVLTNKYATSDLFLMKVAAGISRAALLPASSTPGSLTLSWSLAAADWVLMYTPDFTVPFSPIYPTRTTNGAVISVTIPTTGPGGYYDLRHP